MAASNRKAVHLGGEQHVLGGESKRGCGHQSQVRNAP